MSVFNVLHVNDLKIYDSTMFHLEEAQEEYLKYANKLLNLPPAMLNNIVIILRDRNIIENQEAENDNSFLISLIDKQKRKSSISELVKIYESKGYIDLGDVKYIHKLILAGSVDDVEENYHYRTKPDQWVGKFDSQGNKIIDYELLQSDKVIETLQCMLDYLNGHGNTIMDNIFIKPMVFHLLFAVLQPFGNGNTRTARLLQHGKIWSTTNEMFNNEFRYPILYLSKNYTLTGHQYREVIKNVAVNHDSDSWNKWFKYNLNMIDEQLLFVNNNLDEYIKLRK